MLNDNRAPDDQDATSEVGSQTAEQFINEQLQLEVDAKEALPYQFDTCTKPLGPLRQSIYSCLTCSPTDPMNFAAYPPAGICYSCSISCHGDHELVELFSKRDFECDCGSTRMPTNMPCSLRSQANGRKGGVLNERCRSDNKYNQNFKGRFCACNEVYDPAKEKGTMFQCLGLGTVEDGGCGEDWWHPECLLGMERYTIDKAGEHGTKEATQADKDGATAETVEAVVNGETPLPPGFPAEEDFDHLLCYKCVESQPWMKQYAHSPGFIDFELPKTLLTNPMTGIKRKLEDDEEEAESNKKNKVDAMSTPGHAEEIQVSDVKVEGEENGIDGTSRTGEKAEIQESGPKHARLSQAPEGRICLFLKEDFRDHFCRCPECFPRLSKFPQLLEEEEAYEPPISESDQDEAPGSVGSKSLLDRGEAALSTMDRMRAIEGVMAYNHLKDKVKAFLQPFADSGQAVGAEDVKDYFAKLRGDEDALRAAAASADGSGSSGANRREQNGY